jgi:mRNA interferase HigB
MKVLGRQLLTEFKKRHADARSALDAWLAEAGAAEWTKPQDIKNRYRGASFLKGNQVVFNIKGNRYRLLVTVAYQLGFVTLLWVGTHEEYETW